MSETGSRAAGGHPGTVPRANGRSLSAVLGDLAGDDTRDRISVGDLLAATGDRAIAALMLVLALPNVLPTPPGTSSILGLPLIVLACQLTLGMRPWLPRIIADRSMLRRDFAYLVERAVPWLAKAEILLRPRLGILVRPPAEYAIGAVCLLLALILALPVPLGNMAPALAICIMSFGILERDGVWAAAGVTVAVASVALAGGVVYGLLKGAIFLMSTLLT